MNIESKFFIETAKGYVWIKLVGDLDQRDIASFENKLADHLGETPLHLIINCEHTNSLSKEWLRYLVQLESRVKALKKSMRLILVTQALKQLICNEGLDGVLRFSATLKHALDELGIEPRSGFDAEFINPFLNSTLHVLKVQANITASAGKPYVKDPASQNTGDISGIIGIVSDAFNGSVVISFPEKTFLCIMSGMLGETISQMSKDIVDGAGELTNMIFGQAKITLNEKGYGIKIAIPSVVAGKDHTLTHPHKGAVVVIPFTGTAGNFFIEICLSE